MPVHTISHWVAPCSPLHTTILLSRIQHKGVEVSLWLCPVGGTSTQRTLRIARASSESFASTPCLERFIDVTTLKHRLLIDSMLNVDPDGRPDIDKVGRSCKSRSYNDTDISVLLARSSSSQMVSWLHCDDLPL